MSLADRLRARIEREGPIPTRVFVEAALYDPEEGYYVKGPAIGAAGDFYTASNVSLFPQALARFVEAAQERLGGARIVELGGGSGELAGKLGPDATVVEPSGGLASKQRARGLRVVASLRDLEPAPTVFVANEVLDALPPHRVRMTAAGLRELHVAAKDGGFVEVEGPLTDPRLDAHAPHLEVGETAEVSLATDDLLAALDDAAPRSIALFLDYAVAGGRRDTLRGFHQHRVTGALERPGEQDVTADVDFGLVARLAKGRGSDVLGDAAQGAFLADLGLLDDMMVAMQRGDTAAYMAGKNLLMPTGMGERFRALCLGRGVAKDPPLPGFRPDIMPGAGRR